jgi:uncharacterized membrane protein
MQVLYYIMLSLHIAGGTAALLLGLFIIIARKGTKLHRRAGRIYFWAMTAVCASALFMAVYKNIPFLLMIAVFSYYPAYNGYRRVRDKANFKSGLVDKIIYIISAVFCLGMVVYSLMTMNIVLGVFTLLFVSVLRLDFAQYMKRGAKPSKAYILSHIGSILGSYIAAVTAFVVVNYSGQIPELVLWLGPTIVGTPVISIYIARYARRLKGNTKSKHFVVTPA